MALFKMDRLAAKETKWEEKQKNRDVKQASHIKRKTTKRAKKMKWGKWEEDCQDGCEPEGPELAPAPPAKLIIRGQSSETLNARPDLNNRTRVIQAYAKDNQGTQTTDQFVTNSNDIETAIGYTIRTAASSRPQATNVI